MARQGRQARLFADIWRDEDWRALGPLAQWLYELLLSQPDLSLCGVLALQPKRWAKLAAGVTPEAVEEFLAELERARFVIVDRDTDEILVRTFVRHDVLGGRKNGNVIVGMSRDIHKIHSTDLQRAVVAGLPADWEEHLPAGVRGRLDEGFCALIDNRPPSGDGPENGRNNARSNDRQNGNGEASERPSEHPLERDRSSVRGDQDHQPPHTDPSMRRNAGGPGLSPGALVDAAIDELTDQRVAKATAEGFTPNHPDRFRASERSKVATAVGADLAELVQHPSITDVGALLEAWRSLVAERDLLGQARTFGANRGLCPDVTVEEFADEADGCYERGSTAWEAAVDAFTASRRRPDLRVVSS